MKWYIIIFFFVLSFVGALWSAPQTNAISDWDNVYRSTTSLEISRNKYYNTVNCAPENVTLDWTKYLTNNSGSTTQWEANGSSTSMFEVKESFNRALNNLVPGGNSGASMMVSQGTERISESNPYLQKSLYVAWNETTGLQTEFLGAGQTATINVTNTTHNVWIINNNGWGGQGYASCDVLLYYGLGNVVSTKSADYANTWIGVENFLLNTSAPINYPVGYEGLPIVSEVVEDAVYEPKTAFSVFEDNTVKGYSSEGTDFCIITDIGGCIEPKLKWTIKDINEEIIDVQELPVWKMYEYKVAMVGQYSLTVEYIWPGVPYADFADNVVLNKVVYPLPVTGEFYNGGSGFQVCSVEGTTKSCLESTYNLVDCVTGVFPFVDLPGCMRNIGGVVNILSFKVVTFKGTEFTQVARADPNNCYTLQTLGEWLNLENKTICPAFSSEIRNIVTPFITFILGAVVFTYISRGRGVVIN